MFRFTVIAIALLCLANAERTFLGENSGFVASVVDNGESKLTRSGALNINASSSCLEDLSRIDDLIEQLSEFFVSSSHNLETITLLDGGFESIIESCVSEFSSPDLMDCSNDVEGIETHLDQIISILTENPDASFSGLNPDSLARAKEVCIVPVADEICELELSANLEDTNDLLADVYGVETAADGVILQSASEAARELKTIYYACDLTENATWAAIELAVLRVLLVIEECEIEFEASGAVCDTINGEELQELVSVLQANGIIGQGEDDEGQGEDIQGQGEDVQGQSEDVQDIAETETQSLPAPEISGEAQVYSNDPIPVLVGQE